MGQNNYFSAMSYGTAADWLRDFARIILNRTEHGDWFDGFFVVGRRILENSNLENSKSGLIFEIRISKNCSKHCEVLPGELCVPNRYCWVLRPVQTLSLSSSKGAHSEFTLRSQGEEQRCLLVRIVRLNDCTNRKLFFSIVREQVKIKKMNKGSGSNANAPMASKLPTKSQ